MVYCPDQLFLFAHICVFFERLNYNIMEAKIHTTQHGYALDSFLIMAASNDKTNYRDVMNYIEYELAQELTGVDTLPAPHAGRINRQLKHFPITPKVSITSDEKGRHTLSILAGDRPGYLHELPVCWRGTGSICAVPRLTPWVPVPKTPSRSPGLSYFSCRPLLPCGKSYCVKLPDINSG